MSAAGPEATALEVVTRTWAYLRARSQAGPGYRPDHVGIAACRIAQQAGRAFGLWLRPRPVQAMVANPVAHAAIVGGMQDLRTQASSFFGRQGAEPDWPQEAVMAFSNDTPAQAGGYPGHLVLTLCNGADTLLADPSLPRFQRPGLEITAPLLGTLPGPDLQGVAVFHTGDAVVSYHPYDDRGAFRLSADWKQWRPRYRQAVGAIVRQVRRGA
ncbi:hypothetical protein ACFFMN_23350 [Planobispora siamensis]|uniref:Uncharacterized protein n=1 Tax=Planobispora siamensis TaxID=936338 RepID=A0A8J3WLH3_9ACTN|nr:hypothetical protein [Planobispora siamensis]GIH95299.1 hypothetical protein Psi01_59290 [Planobispora siamensis]